MRRPGQASAGLGRVRRGRPGGKERAAGVVRHAAQVQVLLNIFLFGMDVQQAIDAPRFRHWRASSVTFESSIEESAIRQLRAMGHQTQDPLMDVGSILSVGENMGLIYGGAQAVMKGQRGYIAGSDSRRDGLAAAH